MAPEDSIPNGPSAPSTAPANLAPLGARAETPEGVRDSPRWLRACPLCQADRLDPVFALNGHDVVRCSGCRLLMLNPQPGDAELAAIYHDGYALGSEIAEERQRVASLKRATARRYLSQLARYRGGHGGRLLEVGCGSGDFLAQALAEGYDVTGVEPTSAGARETQARLGGRGHVALGTAEERLPGLGGFDVCALWDVLEHSRDPAQTLGAVRDVLLPGGVLALTTPSLDSGPARVLGRRWMEFKPEHLFYFDRHTLETLLFRSGFHEVVLRPTVKVLSLAYVARHFERFPVGALSPLVAFVSRVAPDAMRQWPLPVPGGGITAFARRAPDRARRRLSVVVPAYNEATTLRTVMDRVMTKELPGIDVEVILVESGSTDGTREIARSFEGRPRVRVVTQDRARGKGHAVRAGLDLADGDFVLIQDADLEYEVDDYDALLEPLEQGRAAFVLGARHGGRGGMRVFTDNPLLALLLNAGHWLFTALVNALFLQRLRDPFTMYKVFRRDCLFGLDLRCNRFDFDFELLALLVRKGYRPLEVPVRYRSRSFEHGKKVSVWRDPPTWLRALVALRFRRVDVMGWVARRNARATTAR